MKSRHHCGLGCSCSKHITCVNKGESAQGNLLIEKNILFIPITITDIQSDSESDNAEIDSSDDELTGKEEYYCLSHYACFQQMTQIVTIIWSLNSVFMQYNLFNQQEVFKFVSYTFFILPYHLYYHCI